MSHPSPEETLQDCLEPPKTLQDELLDALLHAPEEFSHSSQLTRVEDQDTAAERDALEREQLLHSTYQDRRARQLAELPPQQRLELTRNPSLMERYGDAEIILAVQDTEALDHGLLQGEDPNYSMFVTSSPSGSPEAPAAGSDPARREAIDGIDQVHQGMCSYLKPLLSRAACTWTVLLCGELHSGKTQVAQKLFTSTDPRHAAYIPHSMDTMKEEVARGISLRMHVATVLMQTRAGKSFPLQIVDTPGHACFEEEVACAASVADVGILVVDVAEGITQGTRRCVHHIIEAQLPCILLLNKLDRLILELHLPPVDAFAHLQYLIRSVNQLLSSHPRWNRATTPYVSPVDATVIFASAAQEWSWTLASLAERYAMSGAEIAQTLCASHLWTPWWWSPSAAQLLPKKKTGHPSPAVALPDDAVPSFVALVLEPWYKLTSVCVSEEPERTAEILEQQDASVRSKFSKIEIQSTSSLISAAFRVLLSGGTQGGSRQGNSSAYQPTTGSVLADVIWNRFVVPSRTRARSEQEVTESTPTVVCICRFLQFPASSAERELRFYAVSRVISGRLRVGQKLRGTCHQTDLSLRNRKMEVLIPGLFVAVPGMGAGSSLVPIDNVGEGAIVLIPGLDVPESVLTTHGVLYSPECTPAEYTPFRALEGRSVIRLGIEPFKPNELPQLTEGLRLLQRAFPTLTLRVEETGERILTGTGELYLDVAMKFLRTYYAKIEIKVSDPSVCFREGVSQASTDFTTVSTYRDTNTFSFIVHPLSRELSAHLERGNHPTQTPLTAEKGTTSSFQEAVLRCAEVAKWDTLTTHSVWALGPDRRWGANLLFNDILAPMEETDDEDPFPTAEAEVSLRRLNHTRDTIISGFIWATVEGPLCGEPLHGIGVRLTSAQLALDPAQRSIGHIQPCVRQAVHLAIMAAKPTLLEPVYEYEILAGIHEGRGVAYNVLTRRRGKVLSEKPQPCTPIVSIIAHVPAIELFGMETELRLLSKGDCFCQGIFSHWATVPGDPSQDVPLKVNEAAPIHKLARDCVQKTRRRRGMNPL